MEVVTESSAQIESHLLIARVRVSPVRMLTIPRLGLLGAVLAADLVNHVNPNLDESFQEHKIFYRTDSMNALCWLQNQFRALKTFVLHRVTHIRRENLAMHNGNMSQLAKIRLMQLLKAYLFSRYKTADFGGKVLDSWSRQGPRQSNLMQPPMFMLPRSSSLCRDH